MGKIDREADGENGSRSDATENVEGEKKEEIRDSEKFTYEEELGGKRYTAGKCKGEERREGG